MSSAEAAFDYDFSTKTMSFNYITTSNAKSWLSIIVVLFLLQHDITFESGAGFGLSGLWFKFAESLFKIMSESFANQSNLKFEATLNQVDL